jgi:hypothetical protein
MKVKICTVAFQEIEVDDEYKEDLEKFDEDFYEESFPITFDDNNIDRFITYVFPDNKDEMKILRNMKEEWNKLRKD